VPSVFAFGLSLRSAQGLARPRFKLGSRSFFEIARYNALTFSLEPDLSDRLAVWPQYVMPKRALTVLAGRMAGASLGKLTHWFINRFVARYQVDMSQAAVADTSTYASFNEFFTRPLREGARPLADAAFVSPVDGAISQCGPIERDQIFQAKGHHYSIRALVGGDAALAALFENGQFATLYLSPRDYHRIHMPCDGRLLRMIYVPGDLFSVNPTTARGVPGLFARNERVVCVFEGTQGPFVLTLVGATIVGSMQTVWHGLVNPPRPGVMQEWRYETHNIQLQQGQEMGRFLLGSTVVMLFPQGVMQFNPDWTPTRPLKMGEAMGKLS
jgi:phosphatidylserine decarboxylase